MKYSCKTDTGRVRQNNQDSHQVINRDNYLCVVVCDGMGGASGGNVASQIAVKTFCTRVRKNFSIAGPDELTSGDVSRILGVAAEDANEAVYNKALYEPGLEGMGTTLVACIAYDGGAVGINIGDSRLYVMQDGRLSQVSEDHSFVQYLINKGAITPDEAKHHPNKNIILKAVGINESVTGDIFFIKDYDYILLCTDGLTNMLEDFEIQNILAGTVGKRISLSKKAETLIELANSRGGTDNITVAIIGRN